MTGSEFDLLVLTVWQIGLSNLAGLWIQTISEFYNLHTYYNLIGAHVLKWSKQ